MTAAARRLPRSIAAAVEVVRWSDDLHARARLAPVALADLEGHHAPVAVRILGRRPVSVAVVTQGEQRTRETITYELALVHAEGEGEPRWIAAERLHTGAT